VRRRRRPYYRPNQDRWLISYADYVTLLLALFVVLYAMSTVDAARLESVVAGMRTAFVETGTEAGGIEAPILTPGGSKVRESNTGKKENNDVSYVLLRDRLEDTVGKQQSAAQGEIPMQSHRSDRGLVISVAANDFFEPGETQILRSALDPLNAIGAVLALSSQPIRIEGHTDDIPIKTSLYPSNWELSTARASAVARHMIERLNIAPQRIGASGYAEYRPIVPNDSAENRAINRRIDIVVLKSAQAIQEEPEASGGPDPTGLETLLNQLPPLAVRSRLQSALDELPPVAAR
jgi:chemotaxis protein MotB